MPDAPFALRSKVETALVSYLAARVAAAGTTAMSGVSIRQRQEITPANKTLPLVVVEVVSAPAFEDMNELYMCDVMVALGGLATEADGATRHAQRTGLLTEWLADRAAFLAHVGGSPAPVPGLVCHDILLQEEQGEQTGEHWLEALGYLVPAQLADA